jgi:hypothetical protein
VRAFVIAGLLGLGLAVAASTTASATTITEPSAKTVEVGIGDHGYAAPVTVKASGFQPFENVFIEMCNGRPPTGDSWMPSVDCDLGSAPAAAVADEKGVATFAADDPNHSLFPFVGPGPQELFQCFASGKTGPARAGIESYTNCQLRVSTSNNEATDDQVFVTLALPAGAKTGWGSPQFPKVPAAVTSGSGASRSVTGGERPAKAGAAASNEAANATSASSGSGASSSDDFPMLPVVLSIVVVAGGAVTVLVLHKRRSGRVAA